MFHFNNIFTYRIFWFVLILSALIWECIVLLLQYFFYFKPCVLCIYQRGALYGIIFAGLIGIIAPNKKICRYSGILLCIYSAIEGMYFAMKYVRRQLYPSPFDTCDFSISFPTYFRLDKWIPFIFNPIGDCLTKEKQFLLLEISQWSVIIFGLYLIIIVLILLINLFYYIRLFLRE
ncbi:disulfide bond formation protein DsbB [Candidatus Schneideria nysicola]|uniref:disulfide bond formation protein DsbB n=1 Tax=Candidatus Schneideria nysicola TaxID=1081631 RepID=UPI001CAA5129|nr:disulfide bond formation protein DsbB [Candidatus Schneideria nysicola]UAJ64848.1 disulfide bond formation protein DsbB [Candidatus Schneideria nysicola]